MVSSWSDEQARIYKETFAAYGDDVALRVYTTRLLGRDPSLVLHGGGNTSVKTTQADELGNPVEVLRVKGSGWDMGSIEPEGLPAVCLEPIRGFRQLDALSDEAMVNGVRRNLLDVSAPTPSVETLLHAFLPHKFIDHTHADAVLALVNQRHAVEICREIFGERFGLVPYIMPGFALSKKAAEVYEENPEVEGLILINHGIFSFGPTAKSAYERMMNAVARAGEYLETLQKNIGTVFTAPVATSRPETFAEHLAALRGCLSHRPEGIGHMVLEWRKTDRIDAFLDRSDLTEIATRGTATPDHVIRTKQKPMIFAGADLKDATTFKSQVDRELDQYTVAYRSYFETQNRKQGPKKPLHPLPLVILVPGMGLITAGKTPKEAAIVADIYEHTIGIIQNAELVGRYQPLPDDRLFEMEYWSLEQAKLGKKKPKPLAGKVALVTGAQGGIGKAIATTFATQGANLVLTDQDETALAELAAELQPLGVAVAHWTCDLTREDAARALVRNAVCRFGGIDILISNAGTAPNGPISRATDQLKNSLQINLMAHQYLASAVTDYMTLVGVGGCLLFNASKSAFNPGPGFGAYSVAKAGLIALMKQYAIEFAEQGIRAAAVNADRIRTGLYDLDLLRERARARGLEPDQYFRANMLGVEVLPEDVAAAFYHLCLSEKSTGTVATVDGGNIAASPR